MNVTGSWIGFRSRGKNPTRMNKNN